MWASVCVRARATHVPQLHRSHTLTHVCVPCSLPAEMWRPFNMVRVHVLRGTVGPHQVKVVSSWPGTEDQMRITAVRLTATSAGGMPPMPGSSPAPALGLVQLTLQALAPAEELDSAVVLTDAFVPGMK